jgi:hydrogenase maturation protein HypF
MAIRQPWRMAIAYLSAAGVAPDDLGVVRRHRDLWPAVAAVAQQPQFSPLTSSMGRLFDATAALVGVRDEISYEGQAAVELEQLVPGHADRGHAVRGHADRSYTVGIGRAHAAGPLIVEGADIIRAVTADLLAGTPDATIAACFHQTVADLVVALAGQIRTERGLDTVALSGGVFQNMIVLNSAVAQLGALGFRVLTHRRVPANDGGISLGQAAVAAARDGAPTGAANGGAC